MLAIVRVGNNDKDLLVDVAKLVGGDNMGSRVVEVKSVGTTNQGPILI